MQIVGCALGLGSRLEDGAFVITQYLQPAADIAGMIRPGLKFRRNTEICTEESTAEFRNEFFARAR